MSEVPQEIWWLVCRVLTKYQDFDSLFHFALVSRSSANHALKLLYSIHELSTVSTDDTTIIGKEKWATMWRSIILSSVGETAYPYCLWIKSLKLGDLGLLLDEVAPSAKVSSSFFSGPMDPFQILSGTSRTRSGRPRFEVQRIIEKVGDTITRFVQEASDEEDKRVLLSSLEGFKLPTPLLSTWISRLSTLMSLTLRDGSVLTAEVAQSISENCPMFKDLVCFHIVGENVDTNMGAFFRQLKQNSLETFIVLSTNQLGLGAFEGLTHHSSSLRGLHLASLQNSALPNLNALSTCKSLGELFLEASDSQAPSTWATDNKESFLEVISWLKSCKSLKVLDMKRIYGGSTLLGEVFKSTELRLTSLDVHLQDDDEAFYSSLGHQTELESIVFHDVEDPVPELLAADQKGRHSDFMDSICSCKKLRELNLVATKGEYNYMQLAHADLVKIKDSLPLLEELSFDSDILRDEVWEPLSQIPRLNSLNTSGLTLFTFNGILTFINTLKTSGPHPGFRLSIMSQVGEQEAKLSPEEEALLSSEMIQAFDGRFELVYWRDEEELDLSD